MCGYFRGGVRLFLRLVRFCSIIFAVVFFNFCYLSLHFLRLLGVLGVRVQGSRFSATCVNLDGNIGVNGATIDI